MTDLNSSTVENAAAGERTAAAPAKTLRVRSAGRRRKPLSNSTKPITLVSNDGNEFSIPVGAALLSTIIQEHIYNVAEIDVDVKDDDDDEGNDYGRTGHGNSPDHPDSGDEEDYDEPDAYPNMDLLRGTKKAVAK
jgi:hypothetical protein